MEATAQTKLFDQEGVEEYIERNNNRALGSTSDDKDSVKSILSRLQKQDNLGVVNVDPSPAVTVTDKSKSVEVHTSSLGSENSSEGPINLNKLSNNSYNNSRILNQNSVNYSLGGGISLTFNGYNANGISSNRFGHRNFNHSQSANVSIELPIADHALVPISAENSQEENHSCSMVEFLGTESGSLAGDDKVGSSRTRLQLRASSSSKIPEESQAAGSKESFNSSNGVKIFNKLESPSVTVTLGGSTKASGPGFLNLNQNLNPPVLRLRSPERMVSSVSGNSLLLPSRTGAISHQLLGAFSQNTNFLSPNCGPGGPKTVGGTTTSNSSGATNGLLLSSGPFKPRNGTTQFPYNNSTGNMASSASSILAPKHFTNSNTSAGAAATCYQAQFQPPANSENQNNNNVLNQAERFADNLRDINGAPASPDKAFVSPSPGRGNRSVSPGKGMLLPDSAHRNVAIRRSVSPSSVGRYGTTYANESSDNVIPVISVVPPVNSNEKLSSDGKNFFGSSPQIVTGASNTSASNLLNFNPGPTPQLLGNFHTYSVDKFSPDKSQCTTNFRSSFDNANLVNVQNSSGEKVTNSVNSTVTTPATRLRRCAKKRAALQHQLTAAYQKLQALEVDRDSKLRERRYLQQKLGMTDYYGLQTQPNFANMSSTANSSRRDRRELQAASATERNLVALNEEVASEKQNVARLRHELRAESAKAEKAWHDVAQSNSSAENSNSSSSAASPGGNGSGENFSHNHSANSNSRTSLVKPPFSNSQESVNKDTGNSSSSLIPNTCVLNQSLAIVNGLRKLNKNINSNLIAQNTSNSGQQSSSLTSLRNVKSTRSVGAPPPSCSATNTSMLGNSKYVTDSDSESNLPHFARPLCRTQRHKRMSERVLDHERSFRTPGSRTPSCTPSKTPKGRNLNKTPTSTSKGFGTSSELFDRKSKPGPMVNVVSRTPSRFSQSVSTGGAPSVQSMSFDQLFNATSNRDSQEMALEMAMHQSDLNNLNVNESHESEIYEQERSPRTKCRGKTTRDIWYEETVLRRERELKFNPNLRVIDKPSESLDSVSDSVTVGEIVRQRGGERLEGLLQKLSNPLSNLNDLDGLGDYDNNDDLEEEDEYGLGEGEELGEEDALEGFRYHSEIQNYGPNNINMEGLQEGQAIDSEDRLVNDDHDRELYDLPNNRDNSSGDSSSANNFILNCNAESESFTFNLSQNNNDNDIEAEAVTVTSMTNNVSEVVEPGSGTAAANSMPSVAASSSTESCKSEARSAPSTGPPPFSGLKVFDNFNYQYHASSQSESSEDVLTSSNHDGTVTAAAAGPPTGSPLQCSTDRTLSVSESTVRAMDRLETALARAEEMGI